MNTKTLSLKSLSGWDEFGTWRGFDLWNCVLEWMLELLYWMWTSENLDGFEWGGWGVFIAPQLLPSRWQGLLAMGAPDRHCSLSGACHVSTSIRVLSSWPLERLVVLLHRTVRWPLTSVLWLLPWHYSSLFIRRRTVGTQGAVALLAHRTVQWIIVERARQKPESGWFAGCLG
jgi:hypothetical protein